VRDGMVRDNIIWDDTFRDDTVKDDITEGRFQKEKKGLKKSKIEILEKNFRFLKIDFFNYFLKID
jgi:hypothetical protein